MNSEILSLLDYLERDRGVDRQVLATLIEEAVEAAAKKPHGPEHQLTVKLDPRTGDLTAKATYTVVKRVTDADTQINLRNAQTQHPDAKVGDVIEWDIPPETLGRIVAQTARQGIMNRLREAERLQVSEEFKDRIGEVLYGTVSRYDKYDIVVQVERTEGVLRHGDRVNTEDYQLGDHISCILTGIEMERPGPVLCLSRTTPDLVRLLFEREVTEIAEGIVEIKAVAREAGFRSKIAVASSDPKVDPVGACVGIRGSRVKTVVRELNGEKVDIVRWDPDLKTYITNALQPAEIRSLEIVEDEQTVRILVAEDQLSLAIGKRGQNARLTAKLTGWKVDIVRAEEERELSIEEKMQEAAEHLCAFDGISSELAILLVQSGFLTADGIRAVEVADLEAIEGIDHDSAMMIKAAVGE